MQTRKTRVCVFVLVVTALVAINVVPTWVKSPTASARLDTAMPTFMVDRSTPEEIHFKVGIPEVSLIPEKQGRNGYHQIGLVGAESAGRIGKPDLPVLKEMLVIPESDDITIEARVVKEHKIGDVRVNPTPQVIGYEELQAVPEDRSVYDRAGLYPGKTVEIETIGHIRDQRVAFVNIYPVQFDAEKNELVVYDELEVDVTCVNPSSEVVRDVGPMQGLLSVAVNYEQSNYVAGTFELGGPNRVGGQGSVCWATGTTPSQVVASVNSCGADYLIIMADELNDALVAMLAQKRADFNGFNVAIAKMSQIDATPDIINTPETILGVIKDIYDAESAAHMSDGKLGYVLLLGDVYNPAGELLIPPSYAEALGDTCDGDAASDAYYSFLGDEGPLLDTMADVFLGRIPVDDDPTDWELQNVVSKILSYDQTGSAIKKMLLVSGGLAVGGEDPPGESAFLTIKDVLAPAYVVVDTMHRNRTYPPTSGWHKNFSRDVADYIEQNEPWTVGLFDHGFFHYVHGTIYAFHYDALNNASPHPLFFILGSNTAFFDQRANQPCNYTGMTCVQYEDTLAFNTYSPEPNLDACDVLSERLVLGTNGAIGVINDRTRSYAPSGVFGTFLYGHRAVLYDKAYTLGEIVLTARLAAGKSSSKVPILFGDPALNIMWEEGVTDTVDLALGYDAISLLGGFDNFYADVDDALEIEATVSNLGRYQADNVPVYLWHGEPGQPGSSLIDTDVLTTVLPHGGTATANFQAGTFDAGAHEFYVLVDTTAYDELTYKNNVAHITVSVYPMQNGYPHTSTSTIFVTAELDPNSPGKELLIREGSALQCLAADGGNLWSSSAFSARPLVGAVYKDGVMHVVAKRGLETVVLDGATGADIDTVQADGDFIADGAITDLVVDDGSLEFLAWVLEIPEYTFTLRAYTFDGPSDSDPLWEYPTAAQQFMPPMAVGDADGDGDKEVFFALADAQNSTTTFIALDAPDSPTGSVSLKWQETVSGVAQTLLLVPDERPGETGLDLVVALTTESGGKIERRHGDGSWATTFTTIVPLLDVVAGDTDGDDSPELILTTEAWVATMDASGSLEAAALADGKYLKGLFTADIDGDGSMEVIVNRNGGGGAGVGHWSVDILDGALASVGELAFKPSGLGAAGLTDLDEDGDVEILASDGSSLHIVNLDGTAGRLGWPQRGKYVTQTNVYEQPVKGTYNKDVSLAGDVRVRGSSYFYADAVFVDAGTRVRVEGTSVVSVMGNLKIAGAQGTPAVFSSSQDDPPTPTWVTVAVNLGSGDVSHCEIRDATVGLFGISPLSVRHSKISHASTGIHVVDSLYVDDVDFADCSDVGIRRQNYTVASGMDVNNARFSNVPTAIENQHVGLAIKASITGDYDTGILAKADVTIKDSHVTSGPGLGIHVEPDVVAALRDVTVQGQEDGGIWCEGCASTSTFDQVTARGNTGFGIKLEDGGAVSVDSCRVVDNNIGILCDNSDAHVTWCVVDSNLAGIMCDEGARPVVSYSAFRYNNNAITTAGNSHPKAGQGSTGGNNIIHHSTYFHVVNLNQDQTSPVYVQNDWWGSPQGPKTKKIMGNVVYEPYLLTEPFTPWGMPASKPVGIAEERLPATFYLGHAYPNPFNPSTTIPFEVPSPGGSVEMTVYNVKGQKVARIVDEHVPAGFHTATWKGVDDRGRPVASGVYFVRMLTNRYTETRKLVLLK